MDFFTQCIKRILLLTALMSLDVFTCGLSQASDQIPPGVMVSEASLITALAEADEHLKEEPGVEIAVHQGVLAYQQKQYAAALSHLEASGSKRIAASYYTVLCLIHLDRIDDALQVLNVMRRNPATPEIIDVGVAQALINSGKESEGLDLLQDYTANHPEDSMALALLKKEQAAQNKEPSESSARAVAGLENSPIIPPEPQPERNWNLTFLTGYDYDSNVVRAPMFQGLGSTFQRADSSWINALYGDYRFIQEDDMVAGATASLFMADRFQLSLFDTFNVSGGAYANRAFGDIVIGANYQFVNTLLGNEQFSAEHRLVGNATLLEGSFGHSTVYYEFDANDLNIAALIPAQEQSGTSNSIGATQAIYLFEGAGRLFGGYRYGTNNADGDDFDYHSHMLTTRVEVPVNGQGWLSNWVCDAEFRVFFDRYANPNSLDFMGNRRSDNRKEVRTGLQKYLTEHLSLRFDYTYATSDSNVANLFGVGFYDYDRHAVTSQLIYDF